MSRQVHVAYFSDPQALVEAARECRARGLEVLDVLSPFPLHGIDEVLGIARSRLGWVTLCGALVGLALGLLLQFWTSAIDWPLNVGGKPFNSLPAFVPVGFELAVLVAGLATAGALLWRSRLWPGRRPALDLPATTDDLCALLVAVRGAALEQGAIQDLWARHAAVRWEQRWEEQP